MTKPVHIFIREILETTPGLTQKGLAEHMGLDPAAVNRILHEKRNIMLDEIPLIEDYLGVRLPLPSFSPALSSSLSSNIEYRQDNVRRRGLSDVPAQPLPLPTNSLVPVYGYAAGSLQKGLNLSNGDIIDWVTRHPAQLGISSAFAVYVFSDSMEPRYFQGELVYVHPGRPPEINRDCIIEMKSGDAYIKRFLRQDDRAVRVAQFNPPEEKEIPKEEIKAIYAVVGRG